LARILIDHNPQQVVGLDSWIDRSNSRGRSAQKMKFAPELRQNPDASTGQPASSALPTLQGVGVHREPLSQLGLAEPERLSDDL
jgi:hypothetical protein